MALDTAGNEWCDYCTTAHKPGLHARLSPTAAENWRQNCRARDAKIDRLVAELSAACAYMRNAKIDLETGAPKRTAIRTIEGGLRRAEGALADLKG